MKEQIRVLIVDDDVMLGRILTMDLTEKEYKVVFNNSLNGLQATVQEFRPHILFLDWEIEDGHNSMSAALQLHEQFPNLPVIFVSSHAEADVQRQALLEAGGKAFVKKPVSAEELEVYIKKWAKEDNKDMVSIGQVCYDGKSKRLLKNNVPFHALSEQENVLVKCLFNHAGILVSRKDLVKAIWNDSDENLHGRSLNNLILRLRGYLNEDTGLYIKTVHGIGYVLKSAL